MRQDNFAKVAMSRTSLALAIPFLITSAACSAQSDSQPLRSIDDCRALAQSTMVRLREGDDRAALESLRSQINVDAKEFDESLARTLEQRRTSGARFGREVGIKLIGEEKVSDFLYRVTYVEKRQFQLLRWQFIFYRPAVTWQLNAYTWDNNVTALFANQPEQFAGQIPKR
jgi:hypothetical protein